MVYEAAKKMHQIDNSSNHNDEVKRLSKNCYSETVRCLHELRQLLKAMEALGIVPAAKLNKKNDSHTVPSKNLSCPAYISIDLGLRHKRKHFSGRMFFQAILLQDDFFQGDREANTTNGMYGGKGIRIAEGGRYDDLVRQVSYDVHYMLCDILPLCASFIFLS